MARTGPARHEARQVLEIREARHGTKLAWRARMKLGLSPCVVGLLLLHGPAAAAAPSRMFSHEDALADGDIDGEDVATRSPFAVLRDPTGAHGVLGGGPSSGTYL